VWAVLGVAAVVVFGLLGRKEDQKLVDLPATMAPHEPPPITAPMVKQALCDIGIAKMKDPEGVTLLMDVAADGDGWQVDMELPPGVPVTDVIDRREEFAAALRRELGTVWPAVGPRHPGHMALFISKVPMVGAKQAPWPVASGGKVSLFDPLPLFTDQRGKWVHQTLAYTGWVIGAVPRMGKTRALITLGLAAGFDVRSKVYSFDLKGTGDLSSLAKFAHVYRVGDDPEDIEFMLVQMRKLREEMRARTRLVRAMSLTENPDRGKVTDLLANLDPARYGPIVLLVDEVQVWTEEFTEALPGQWFDDDEKGRRQRPKDPGKEVRAEFIAIMRDLVKRGPALGIIPFFATQKPDAKSIPSSIADNASARLCLKVNGQISNDQILGTSSYQAGVRATQFAFSDKGIAFFRGDGAEPLVVRTVDMTPAEADKVAERIRALRLAAGTLTGQAADEVDEAEIVIDIVVDCITAMRERERGRAHHAELVDWLREMRPENYEALDVDELSTRLRKRGVQIDSFRVPGSPTRRGVYLSSLTSPGETG
jgi:DNA segregation ATPase FtsK/SpoIIIE, S-DNA-T family